jgi:anti-sigma B factor antagonist
MRDLQIQHIESEGIQILALRGQLVIGESEAALRDTVRSLAKGGFVSVIVNFAEITAIDHNGLGALILSAAELQSGGGAMKLVGLPVAHLHPLVLTELEARFEVFNDEQDAVNSFFPARAIFPYDVLDFVKQQEL